MQRENQEKMLQTLLMIQEIQAKGEIKEETPVTELSEVIPSKKSSGIATQMLHELLKNESCDSSVHIERKNTFDTEEVNVPEVKAAPAPVPGQRKRREIFKCPHTDKKHYAKNMCHNCYHRKGKTKMAHACGHPERSHYSSGMCQNCYLAKYYLKRKNKAEEKAKAKLDAETAKSSTEVTSVSEPRLSESDITPKRHFTEGDLMMSSAKKQKIE